MLKSIKILALASAMVSLVACSSTTKTESTITIHHALGTVEVPKNPKRIATVGWENQDTPLALGVVPVGMSAANYGKVTKDNLHPWTAEALDGKKTTVFDDMDGIDYEGVAKVKPDVILAAYSGLTKDQYKKLSKIAPVVAYKKAPWQTKWRDQTIENAAGMNKKKEGQAKVKEVEALIQEKLAAHPELVGTTTGFAWINADDFSKFYVYTKVDPRASYLTDFGLKLPEVVKSEKKNFYVELSRENVDKLTDVQMLVVYGTPDMLEKLQADALMNRIPAIKNGAVAFIDPTSALAGAATPSILSIPSQIDTYLDLLSAARAKVQ